MRSRAPPERFAGSSTTGTLTSPKLTVPDQKARFPWFRSGTLPLLLHAPHARLERAEQRSGLRAPRRARQPRRPALRLRPDEVEDALPVLVPVAPGIEVRLERADELLGEPELLLARLPERGRLEIGGRDDLVGVPERDEDEMRAVRAQRAGVLAIAHHPAR